MPTPSGPTHLAELMIERRLDIFFRCEVRMDIMSRDLLEKLKKAGLFHISFGLEAGSDRVRNEVIGKKVDIRDFRNLVRWSNELGVIPNVFFIFSHPTETWAEAGETIRLIEEYQDRIEASIAILHIYPGTPLERFARETGFLPPDFTWTRKSFSKIITLPLAQGDVPLYVDKLTWSQISELVVRWSFSAKNTSLLRKAPRALKHIRSFGDARRYAILARTYLKLKIQTGTVREALPRS